MGSTVNTHQCLLDGINEGHSIGLADGRLLIHQYELALTVLEKWRLRKDNRHYSIASRMCGDKKWGITLTEQGKSGYYAHRDLIRAISRAYDNLIGM